MLRREALIKTGWLSVSSIMGPSVIGFLSSCANEATLKQDLLVLNTEQFQLLEAIADLILPRTDTPSASDVKTVQFLDLMLNDVYDKEAREQFIAGLDLFDKDCAQEKGDSFVQLESESRLNYLGKLDQEIMSSSYQQQVPFYFGFKQLCIRIYFSTEEGLKQNMEYRPVPGSFQGDVELLSGDKIMVGNAL